MMKKLFLTIFLLHFIFLLAGPLPASAGTNESGALISSDNVESTLNGQWMLAYSGQRVVVGQHTSDIPKGHPVIETMTFAEEEEDESGSSEKHFNRNLPILQSLFLHAYRMAFKQTGYEDHYGWHFSDTSTNKRYLIVQVFRI